MTGDMRQEPMRPVRPEWVVGVTVGQGFQELCCYCGLENSLWVAGYKPNLGLVEKIKIGFPWTARRLSHPPFQLEAICG